MKEKQEIPKDPIRSRPVLEMITLAHDFTAFIEKSEEYSRDQILPYLERIIPAIYLKASLIPAIEVTDPDAIEHYVTEEQWETVFNTLRAKLGAEDEYYYLDLHERSSHDAIRASIAENIADIYQDLKDFLLLIQNPLHTFQENAVRECRHLFETRTGYRLVNCLKAVHYLVYKAGFSGEIPNYHDVL